MDQNLIQTSWKLNYIMISVWYPFWGGWVCVWFVSLLLLVCTCSHFWRSFFFSRANQSDCTSYCQGEDVGFRPSPPHHQSSRVSSSLSLFLSQASLLGKRVALGMRSFFQNMAPILQPTCFLLHDLDWPVFQSSLITHLWVCAGITGYLSSHVPCFLRGKKCSNIILYFPFLL